MNYSVKCNNRRDETLQAEAAFWRTIAKIKRTQVFVQQQEHMRQSATALLELVGIEGAPLAGT